MFSTTNKDGHLIFSTNNNSKFVSIFRANIYYFETDFCEDLCSLLVAIGQKGTFYAIIIAAILSHPPGIFFLEFLKN